MNGCVSLPSDIEFRMCAHGCVVCFGCVSGKGAGVSVEVFDDAATTCLELVKGNFFFPFQQSKQWERYNEEKKRASEEAAAQKTKENKSSACVVL